MQIRSPPPLPTIFPTGRDLVKTRGGKRAQITPMIRFVREFSAARVTTGFLGTQVSHTHSPRQRSICVCLTYRIHEAAKGGNTIEPPGRGPCLRIYGELDID